MSSSLFGNKVKWILGFIGCVLLTSYFHKGEKINGVIWSDQEGYYIYLPAVFINDGFKDLYCYNGCTFLDKDGSEYSFTKYTYGVALMQSPFFIVAQVVAKPLGFEANGRTLPYIWSVMIAAIFYMLGGLYLLGETLRLKSFQQKTISFVLIGLLLGTNLLYYTFRESGMSHVYSFFLLAGLIYCSEKKWATHRFKWDATAAFVLAAMILIRPTNAIAILIPVFWNAQPSEIISRIGLFARNWRWGIVFLLALMILFAPQLYYWKQLTGDYIFYSYGEEGFIYWNRPKMISVLLSPQNGWLVYSPLAVIGLGGIVLMIKDRTSGWLAPLSTLLLATYVFGSWWAWWFGGAFGHRCYVDFLPLLAVPAAVAVNHILSFKPLFKRILAFGTAIAIFINVRMTDIYHGMWDGPNWVWRNYLEKVFEVFYL